MDQRLQFLSSYQKEEMSVSALCREFGVLRPTEATVPARRVNNSGDISWHKNKAFISEVFRFGKLGFEVVTEDFYKVFISEVRDRRGDVEGLRV